MKNVVVVGAGFAGVWGAASAVRRRRELGWGREDLAVSVVAPGSQMVIRPRLYEADPGRMTIPLSDLLAPIGVEHVPATVTAIDAQHRVVRGQHNDGTEVRRPYDRLVVAAGSRLRRTHIPGRASLFDVDTVESAVALEEHVQGLPSLPPDPGLFTAVIIGGGFVGIEVATEMVARLRAVAATVGAADQVRVVVIERTDVVGPELGPGPRPVITDALDTLEVEVRLRREVAAVRPDGVRLDDGSKIPTRTVVWAGGMQASPLAELFPTRRDRTGRLQVDEHLRVAGLPGVYAAGDIAAARVEQDQVTMQSCQHAHAMGKLVGHNVVSDLAGAPLDPFRPDPYVTCMDLGGAGAVYTTGWERTVQSTGADAKSIKQAVNRLIHPPVGDAETLLTAADHRQNSEVGSTR